MGEPELSYVSLLELAAVRGKLCSPVERDLHFEADKSISAYARRGSPTSGHRRLTAAIGRVRKRCYGTSKGCSTMFPSKI
jgi:hypothetical protein